MNGGNSFSSPAVSTLPRIWCHIGLTKEPKTKAGAAWVRRANGLDKRNIERRQKRRFYLGLEAYFGATLIHNFYTFLLHTLSTKIR